MKSTHNATGKFYRVLEESCGKPGRCPKFRDGTCIGHIGKMGTPDNFPGGWDVVIPRTLTLIFFDCDRMGNIQGANACDFVPTHLARIRNGLDRIVEKLNFAALAGQA